MKNKLKLIAVFCTTLFVLLGCGKEETSSFELNQNGVNSVLTYYYNNDLVTKQTATNTYDLKKLGVTEEEAKQQIEAVNNKYTAIDGVTASIESKDGTLIQSLTVDYAKAKISELRKAFPQEFTGDGDKISFKASKEALLQAGYKEKK